MYTHITIALSLSLSLLSLGIQLNTDTTERKSWLVDQYNKKTGLSLGVDNLLINTFLLVERDRLSVCPSDERAHRWT